jgi:hypothetical protein
MGDDFWAQLSLAEFDDRTAHVYAPLTPFNQALEHWTDRQGVLLGVVVLDRRDLDFGYVVLGRDEQSQFRAIEVACSYLSIKEARDALRSMMRRIAESGLTVFPQDFVH